MTEITITLRQILDAEPRYDPRDKGILPSDHDLDAPIPFREIAEKAIVEDIVWCFAYALPGHESLKRHFAVDCAERIQHTMTDARSLNALAVARRHAMGRATASELRSAWDAATAARTAAWDAARTAAWDAARTAAWDAARTAARTAAWDAARTAAWDAARTAARTAAWDAATAARTAARATELEWQTARIVQLTETGEWTPADQHPST